MTEAPQTEEVVLLIVYQKNGRTFVEHPEIRQNQFELIGFLEVYLQQLKDR